MTKKNVPPRLWDYGISWVCETGNVIANSSRYADQRTPLEIVTAETPGITEYLDFRIYEDWCTYKTNAGVAPPELGRWLGVLHQEVGQLMSYWVLPQSGISISCTTVQRVTNLEQQTDEWKQCMNLFTEVIEAKFQAPLSNLSNATRDIPAEKLLDLEKEDPEFLEDFNRVISNETIKDVQDDMEIGEMDPYLNMELGLPRGEDDALRHTHVKRQAIDVEGHPIGRPSTNPLLDSQQYKVEFMGGETKILAPNIIAENLLAQVDEERHRKMLIAEIEDRRINDDAVPFEEGTFDTAYGMKQRRRTTKGWELLVRWKDGSSSWIMLKDLKDAYPVELADYVIANRIQDEPAFA
jgi:hypothetical protein